MPADEFVAGEAKGRRLDIAHLVPWFIIGFLALVACRLLGFVPAGAIAPIGRVATLVTVVSMAAVSMAAIGLGVDVRTVAKAGGPVTAAVVLSLAGLGVISFGLLALLRLV